MKMDESHYMNWYWSEATAAEKRLVDKIGEFGELFADMLFGPDSSTYELIKCQSKPQAATFGSMMRLIFQNSLHSSAILISTTRLRSKNPHTGIVILPFGANFFQQDYCDYSKQGLSAHPMIMFHLFFCVLFYDS